MKLKKVTVWSKRVFLGALTRVVVIAAAMLKIEGVISKGKLTTPS